MMSAIPCFTSVLEQCKAAGVSDEKLRDAVVIGSIVFAMLADAEAPRARPLTRKPIRTRKVKRRNWSG